MDKRERVRKQRVMAATELAERKHGKVEYGSKEWHEAWHLLNRCTRWAIAQMRHDESETEQNYDKPWYVREGNLLHARYEKLQRELEAYGCSIECCGYFCENVYPYDFERNVIVGNGLLHFFD